MDTSREDLARAISMNPRSAGGSMNTTIWRRLIAIGLATGTIALLAAPAAGQTLRRDGSKAAPFVADVSTQAGALSSDPVLRRDGSKAVPFVAPVEPDATAASGDGFDPGDAAIGAGLGAVAVLTVIGGARAVRVRRLQPRTPRSGVVSR
jgi:hypothetical protein